MRGIVVAKYKEDIKWVESLRPMFNIYIYNKDESNANVEYIHLDNVGREQHTFLYHIVTNYDNLDEVTIFAQGDPDPHGGIDTNIKCNSFVSYGVMRPNSGDEGSLSRDASFWPQAVNIGVCKKICDIIGVELKEHVIYGAGGMFAATKETIHKHPKSIYEELLQLSISEPSFAWAMERLVPRVFNG